MIRFAICDDNEIQVDITHGILSDYLAARWEETSITDFHSGTALLSDVRRNGSYDVYILDMIMPGMNGLELATTLRMLNDDGKIVFLTASLEYAVQSYDVQASHYLLKPIEVEKFNRVMGMLLSQLSLKTSDIIEVRTRNGKIPIRMRNIITVSAENRIPAYRLTDGRILTGVSMRHKFREEMAVLLEKPNFVECGVSRVVNLAYIDVMDSESIMMSDGTVLYPPQSAVSTLLHQWMDFRRKA